MTWLVFLISENKYKYILYFGFLEVLRFYFFILFYLHGHGFDGYVNDQGFSFRFSVTSWKQEAFPEEMLDHNHTYILQMMTLNTRLVVFSMDKSCRKIQIIWGPFKILYYYTYWQGPTKGRLNFLLNVWEWELSGLH